MRSFNDCVWIIIRVIINNSRSLISFLFYCFNAEIMLFSGHWYLGQLVNTSLTIATLYLSCAVLYHGFKSKKYFQESRADREKCNGRLNYMLATAGVISPMPRLAATQAVIVAGAQYPTGSMCERVVEASIVCYFISYGAIYIFLWYRQWLFYTHPLLKTNFSKLTRFLSSFSLVIFNIFGVGILVLYLYPDDFKGSRDGCIELSVEESLEINKSTIYVNKKPFVLFGALLFCQLLLFGLFTYPFIKNKQLTKNNASRSASKVQYRNGHMNTVTKSTKNTRKKRSQIFKIIKQSTISMSITVISDCIVLIFVTIFKVPLHVENGAYDIAMVVNILCIVATFSQWKNILNPLAKKREIHPNLGSVTEESSDGVAKH